MLKSLLKSTASGIAAVLVAPAVGLYCLGLLMLGPEQSFSGWSQAMSLFPGLTGAYLRRAFYRMVLQQCGTGSLISFGTVISHPTARIGRDVYIGPFCSLGDITLEDDVLIGSHVSIANGGGQHGIERLDIPIREQPGAWPRVIVGTDAWIGDRAVVLADVGRHAVVAAGAVVTRPIPDYAIVAGVPARVLRYRTDERPESLRVDVDAVACESESTSRGQLSA